MLIQCCMEVKAPSIAAKITKETYNSEPHKFWENEGPSFSDFIDVINPLQHIPLVSAIYQGLTGDKISNGAKVAGSVLYGGPLGFVTSTINSIIEHESGKDINGHLTAMLFDSKPQEPIQIANIPTTKPWIDPDKAPPKAKVNVDTAIPVKPEIKAIESQESKNSLFKQVPKELPNTKASVNSALSKYRNDQFIDLSKIVETEMKEKEPSNGVTSKDAASAYMKLMQQGKFTNR